MLMFPPLIQYHIVHGSLCLWLPVTSLSTHGKSSSHHPLSMYLFVRLLNTCRFRIVNLYSHEKQLYQPAYSVIAQFLLSLALQLLVETPFSKVTWVVAFGPHPLQWGCVSYLLNQVDCFVTVCIHLGHTPTGFSFLFHDSTCEWYHAVCFSVCT